MGEEAVTEITSTIDLQWLDQLIYFSIPVLWDGTKVTHCDPWGILVYHPPKPHQLPQGLHLWDYISETQR